MHAIMAEPGAGTVRAEPGQGAWAARRRRWSCRPAAGAPTAPHTPGPSGHPGGGRPASRDLVRRPWPRWAGPRAGGSGARQSSAAGRPSTSQVRRATCWWPTLVRCSRSGLQARVSLSARIDHRSTRSQPWVVGDPPQVHVVGGDPAAQQPDHREHARIEAGEDEHPAADGLQRGHRGIELRGQLVHVGPAQDVVTARGQAHQVRGQLDGARHLLGDHLGQQLAADGQVGVPEPGHLPGQHGGHPVGPAA